MVVILGWLTNLASKDGTAVTRGHCRLGDFARQEWATQGSKLRQHSQLHNWNVDGGDGLSKWAGGR